MNLASIFKQIVDGLWAAGGIGASADLGLEDFGAHWAIARGPAPCPVEFSGVRGSRRPAIHRNPGIPLEGELCWNPCARRSVR